MRTCHEFYSKIDTVIFRLHQNYGFHYSRTFSQNIQPILGNLGNSAKNHGIFYFLFYGVLIFFKSYTAMLTPGDQKIQLQAAA